MLLDGQGAAGGVGMLPAQLVVGGIEQSDVAAGTDGVALYAEAVVVGHRVVEQQREAWTVGIGFQLVAGNIDGGRRGNRRHVTPVQGLVAQPELVAVFGP